MKIKLTDDECFAFIDGYDGWKFIKMSLYDTHKGIETYTVISQRESDGKFFAGQYNVKYNEGMFPFGGTPTMEIIEVVQRQVTVTTYEPVTADINSNNLIL